MADKTDTYSIWVRMRQRCNDKNYHGYALYGGRGIKVCERWNDFKNFLDDMGERPSKDHSIERKDNNGGYEPNNCCWATRLEQNSNKRTNRNVTIGSVTKTVMQWSKELGVKHSTILQRLDRGWSGELAVKIPPMHNNYHFIKKPRRCRQ